jgi:hypothetical protein
LSGVKVVQGWGILKGAPKRIASPPAILLGHKCITKNFVFQSKDVNSSQIIPLVRDLSVTH